MTDTELDILVAEKVMGWKTRQFGDDKLWISTEPLPNGDVICIRGSRGDTRGCWMPSTDIAAAWQVVEHMKTTLPRWSAFRITQGAEYFHAEWNVWTDDGTQNTGAVSDASAPRAICLAALKALGIEIQETA